VLNNDTYRVIQDSALTTTTADGLLANDYDPGMLPMTASVVTMPSHGTLNLNPDGTFIYTPTAGYFGPDSFTYSASDGTYTSVTPGSVSITVVSAAPVPTNDTYSVDENGTLTTTATNGVLANDHDPNHQTLTAILVGTGPAHGTVTVNSDGSFTYVPTPFYNGPDSFKYQAFDAAYTIGTVATVNITVNHVGGVNANPDAYTTAAGTALTTTAANGLLANDVNDGVGTSLLSENLTGLTLQPFPTGTHGQNSGVTNNPNGDWTDSLPTGWTRDNAPTGHTATPSPDPTQPAAQDYYGWHVFDIDSWIHEQGNQARNTFLNEKNYGGYSQATSPSGLVGSHAPVFVADGDAYFDYNHTTPGGLLSTYLYTPSIPLAGVNANSLKLDFDSSFRPESGSQNGAVDVSYDGGTTWQNLLAYNNYSTGSISPNVGNLANANEHVTLAGNNPAGATSAMFRFGYLDASNEWWWAIANVNVTAQTPVGGPPPALTAAVAAQPHNGTVSISPNGAFTYTPNAGFTGLDSFTYTASDGTHTSAPQTASVLVGGQAVNVQVNDGSAQRSRVTSLTVAFNGVASFASSAFTLTRVGLPNGGAGDNATLQGTDGTISVSTQVSNGVTLATLTFSGANTTDGSLNDGNWTLTVNHADVTINGTQMSSDYSQTDIKRLYGDFDGNGVVNAFDFAKFRLAFGSSTTDTSYLQYLDYDGNGAINAFDFAQFRLRYGSSV
jgi:hypothetical protein